MAVVLAVGMAVGAAVVLAVSMVSISFGFCGLLK